MALTDTDKALIFNYSQQLLQQDMLTNSLFANSNVGKSLRNMVLAKNPFAPLTNPFEAAISGTLRGDAAQTRQSAANVSEASDMVGIAKNAVATIKDALSDMEDIIDKINTGELTASSAVVQADYDALVQKIQGLISGTDFNGIAMLDGSQWGTDQIDSNGNVYIQSTKDGGFNVTFHNLDGYAWGSLVGSQLDDGAGGDIAAQLALVQSFASDIDAVLDTYTTKESSLSSQALALESQAQILDQAAANRMPETTNSLESIIQDMLLSTTGTIFDANS